MVVIEKGVAFHLLSLSEERVMNAANFDEQLPSGPQAVEHIPKQHLLLIAVYGMDGKTAVSIIIAFRLMDI